MDPRSLDGWMDRQGKRQGKIAFSLEFIDKLFRINLDAQKPDPLELLMTTKTSSSPN